MFPIYCVECRREGTWWCRACRGTQKQSAHFFETPSPLNGLLAIWSYHSESPVGELIQQFKYNHSSAISELWAEILPAELPVAVASASVVPVPLYSRRERERGYNQAKIIGRFLAGKLQLPFIPDTLKRVRATRQQARLSRLEREENVRGAFISRPAPSEDVILVDDVFTTGATMGECAAALKANGARRVFGFVLAKGE
ncbi:MAG: ComF family protein [Candidatus Magasanikbacteria bacterium]|nr:ComF family protein [Candidatus Magasanikbacteria bacterium]